MSVNIPQQMLEEIVDDALEDIPAPTAETVCNVRSRPGLAGEIGYKDLKTEIPSDATGVDVPRGAEVQGETIEYDAVAYRALKQVGTGEVTIEDEIEADEYNLDAIEDATNNAVQQAMANIERKFSDFLLGSSMTDGTTASDVYPANWDDGGSTSEPYNDIGNMARDALDADTVVIGGQAVEILRSHPDTKEQVSKYTGTGRASYDIVEDAIRQSYKSIERVITFDQLYDQAASGLALSESYFFDTDVWVGHQARTFMIDPDHPRNPIEMAKERPNKMSTVISYGRFVDFQHPIATLGRYIDDVTT